MPKFSKNWIFMNYTLFKKKFWKLWFYILNPPSRTASVINRVPEVKISERDSGRHITGLMVPDILNGMKFKIVPSRGTTYIMHLVIIGGNNNR